MFESFLNAYNNVPYPCYWLGTNGVFWANTAAEEIEAAGAEPESVRLLLTALMGESELLGEGQSPLQSVLSMRGLEVLPHPEGCFAFSHKWEQVPVDAFSNNLRTPVSNILTTLQSLSRRLHDTHDEAAIACQGQIESLQKNCYQLLRLTTNVELYNIALHKSEGFEVIELCSFVENLCERSSKACRAQRVEFETQLAGAALPVLSDARLLSNAFFNLLRNSLQFTRDGNRIRVTLSQTGRRAVLTLSDRGLGIKPQALPHIFEVYYSEDPYLDGGERPGLGLGLALVSAAVRAMGGTIAAESRFGEGTSITMAFPLVAASPELLESHAEQFLSGLYSSEYIQLVDYCTLPTL
ncbi:HAMP domain-containing histidine kinase [Ruminococcaceae bacterium OttesenSCG-928-I18]|nr:HAMP domain-containing histidine kinase [Ruminococcaceae bacterium OttesenSCG-928-I18]